MMLDEPGNYVSVILESLGKVHDSRGVRWFKG